MKQVKQTFFCCAVMLIANACGTSTTTPKQDDNIVNDVERIAANSPAIAGKTFLTAEIDGKTFTANADALAFEIAGKWVIGGENNDFVLSFELPKQITTGSKMVEASVVIKKPHSTMYHADLAAATIEKVDESTISGTFTFIAKTTNEELLEVKNGKFLAIKNKK
jgi:hypothetical protein